MSNNRNNWFINKEEQHLLDYLLVKFIYNKKWLKWGA